MRRILAASTVNAHSAPGGCQKSGRGRFFKFCAPAVPVFILPILKKDEEIMAETIPPGSFPADIFYFAAQAAFSCRL